MHKLETNDFIRRCKEIFGDKYAYDKTDLDNRDENGKITVSCPIHGDFKIEPTNHLRGIGCGKCANNIKKTRENVIKEIINIHGSKYIIPEDFEYINNKTPFHMICPIHGDFHPNYRNFLVKKHGCKKCSCHIYSNEEFKNEIKTLYSDKFDLKYLVFKGYRQKVKVMCNKCGSLLDVSPKVLLNGNFNCTCEKSKMSLLEHNVAEILDKSNIEYQYNYTDDNWLKFKNKLSLDFFIPKYDAAIECQGRFHFEPYKKNDEKSKDEYSEQYERDTIKYRLCKENGIRLFYFSNVKVNNYFAPIYNDINEIINKIKLY